MCDPPEWRLRVGFDVIHTLGSLSRFGDFVYELSMLQRTQCFARLRETGRIFTLTGNRGHIK